MYIRPFNGVLYNKNKIKDPAGVYCPPYDIISTAGQDGYYRKSPYNVIRLELNRSKDPYASAAKFLSDWRKNGILQRDERPSIYVYGQDFKYKNRMRHTLGFIAAARIEQSRHSQVRPHEKTFQAPKQDREKVLEVVGANLSCIYALVEDNGLAINRLLRDISKGRPSVDVRIDAVRHRIWRMKAAGPIKRLQAAMSDKKAFIADGHHRYEAAANFRDRMKALDKNYSLTSPYNYVMMYFASMEDKNLTILATHRVVKDGYAIPAGRFQVAPVANKKKMLEALDKNSLKAHVFGLYRGRQFSVLKLKDAKPGQRLDVAILHELILNGAGDICYTRDADEAINLVDNGSYRAAFFLNPTPASQIRDTCLIGQKMPHKSTYFYPKLLTGLVMRGLGEDDV
jgi:uncharacterized protein (DUF1015 family)